jgi:hypothetical protein
MNKNSTGIRCFFRLNVDVSNALNPEWIMPAKMKMTPKLLVDSSKLFSKEWVDRMVRLGLPPADKSYLFYTWPEQQFLPVQYAHSDSDPYGGGANIAAFNFVVGPDDYDMVWFDPEAMAEKKLILTADCGDVFVAYPRDFSNEIDRCNIGDTFLTMVRTDIPHCIHAKTYTQRGRLSVSYRVNRSGAWDQYYDHLSKFPELLIP